MKKSVTAGKMSKYQVLSILGIMDKQTYTDFFLILINIFLLLKRKKNFYCGMFLAVIVNVDALFRGKGAKKQPPNNR